MKTLKRALGSFFVGAALALTTIAAYAACDQYIWVQDSPDCHEYHMYTLTGSNCGDDVCVCSYAQTRSVHREDTCEEDLMMLLL